MATVSTVIDQMPYFLQKETGDPAPIYYSASDMRRLVTGIITRPGALTLGALSVAQATNVGMRIKVNSGYYLVDNYLVLIGTDLTIELGGFPANPSATRTHKVYLSIYDGLAGGASYNAKIDVIEDTGSGAGVPNLATSFTQIATLTVAPNQGYIQNKNITDTRLRGGMTSDYTFLYGNLNTGFDAAGSDVNTSNPRAQLSNGNVRLSGAIKRTNGSDFGVGTYDIGTLTSNLQPPRNRFLLGAVEGSSNSWRLQIRTDGTMTATVTYATKYLFLDGMTYDID